MADNDPESKTEEASPKRLQEAFEKGQFAQSPEIGMAMMFFAVLGVLVYFARDKAAEVAQFSAHLFGNLDQLVLTQETVNEWLGKSPAMILGVLAPALMATFAVALVAGGMQSGFRLTTKVTELNLDKLNPIAGFARVYNKDALVRAFGDSVKLSIYGGIVWKFTEETLRDPIFHSRIEPAYLGTFIFDAIIRILGKLALYTGILAALHYAWQWRKVHKDLMMSKEELKEEHKQQEQDPMIKGRRRQMAMRLMQRQMMKQVPTADVVVTNPTHFAVALKYERGKDAAPVVLAKGENLLAQRIKAVAREHGVPMVENKPAARALYRLATVGQPIPTELYQVVAAILSHVYRTHRYYFHRLKARRTAASGKPVA